MWIAFALGSVVFAGLTAILAKCGIRNTDSNLATALRTIVVLIFSWIMVFVVGAQSGLSTAGWYQSLPDSGMSRVSRVAMTYHTKLGLQTSYGILEDISVYS